jgi:peptidoglycan hydrolase-like protein with peptidoglycan-binding domain
LRVTVRAVAFEQIALTPVQLFRLQPAMGLCRRERLAISAPQANAQVALSLPILRTGWHSGESPVERLQFMLNFVTGVDDLDVDGIFGPKTEAAVRSFQQNENLSVDGIVGRRPGWRCCGVGCSALSPASRAARQGFRASPARHRLAARSDPITSALPVSRELRRRRIARRLAVGPGKDGAALRLAPYGEWCGQAAHPGGSDDMAAST